MAYLLQIEFLGPRKKNINRYYMIPVNLLITISSIIILLMSIVCRNKFKSLEVFYFVIIVDLLILMSSLKEKFDEKFYPNYFEIIPNRHPNKYIKNKSCFSRSKEHNDYKEKINQRLNNEREMEELNRNNITLWHELKKIGDMKNENSDYMVNGEW